MTKGILINYDYCTGCHSCEVACKKELGLPKGEFGIKLTETGPYEYSGKEGSSPQGEVGVDLAARRHQGLRHVRGSRGQGQDAHVRAALPGVVPVPRRG